MSVDSKAQITSLFDNSLLGRVERMRLNPRRRLTNRSRGEHLTGRGGSSTDFADFRNYVAGDDIRNVDWNIFARLNRPYVKVYQHEEELHVVLLVDASTSMLFEDKLLRAKQLAAAFGIMGLMSVERVSALAVNQREGAPTVFPAGTGRVRVRRLLEFLERIEGGGDAPIEDAITTMLRLHRGRGIVILLSDFMTLGDLQRPLNLLYSAGLETWGLQILGPSEILPEIEGDLRFVDSETQQTLDITNAGELLNVYQDHRLWMQEQLDLMCRRRNGRFASVNSADSPERMLFSQLSRKGWVLR